MSSHFVSCIQKMSRFTDVVMLSIFSLLRSPQAFRERTVDIKRCNSKIFLFIFYFWPFFPSLVFSGFCLFQIWLIWRRSISESESGAWGAGRQRGTWIRLREKDRRVRVFSGSVPASVRLVCPAEDRHCATASRLEPSPDALPLLLPTGAPCMSLTGRGRRPHTLHVLLSLISLLHLAPFVALLTLFVDLLLAITVVTHAVLLTCGTAQIF